MVRQIPATGEHRDEVSFVAVDGETIVGHVMISDAFLDSGAPPLHRVVMLSPIANPTTHQRKGIGGALIDAVYRAADELGEWGIVLQGDPAVDGQFGFVSPSFFDDFD